MLRGKTILLGLLALAAAAAAGLLAQNWLAAQRAQLESALASRPTPTAPASETKPGVEVLVAAETLPMGRFLKPEHVEWVPFPEEGARDSYFRRSDFEGDVAEDPVAALLDGAVARASLVEGEPLTRPKIVRPGDRGFLAAVLRPGTRAVSVPLNATTGIAGFVFPGDTVDVLLTVTLSVGGSERRVTETILRGLRVLALDQRIDDTAREPELAKTATLEVGPKQAETIAVGLEMGTLSLALRALSNAEREGIADETPLLTAARDPADGDDLTVPVEPEEEAPSFLWDDQATHFLSGLRTSPTNSGDGAPPKTSVDIVRPGETTTQSFSGETW